MKDKDRELDRIVSEYSQASRRIDEILNEPLIRIKAIREDRLKKAISQIKSLVVESLGEEHTKISQIIHKVCRNTNWACDSWGEEELTVAIITEMKEKFV